MRRVRSQPRFNQKPDQFEDIDCYWIEKKLIQGHIEESIRTLIYTMSALINKLGEKGLLEDTEVVSLFDSVDQFEFEGEEETDD